MSSSGLGIILAATVSRWMILPASLIPLAKPDGMAADFVSGLKRSTIFISAVFPLGLACLVGIPGFFALVAAGAAAAAVLMFSCRRINGVTGDVFGMLVEVTETVVLLSLTI
jgi:adenosylcobinamide-GDP ribazoletransferase